jgi:dihydrofolate reductase
MRKIVVHEFITLDSVIQAPGGADEDTDGGFKHGGWSLPYWHDDMGADIGKAFEQADTLLLGRKTWQTHGEAFEPMTDDPFADSMNAFKKYVVSTTLKTADLWRNSTIISSNVQEEIGKLKEQSGKDILIDGSSVLIHTLAENDLVDEYSLHVHPLVLGDGKRLFPKGKRLDLKLVETKAFPTGVTHQLYQVIR